MLLGHLSGGHVGEALQELLLIPRPGTENRLCSCSKISPSYGSLKSQRQKQAALRTTIIGWLNIQERQEGRNGDKTLTNSCTDLMVSSLCWWKWRIPNVELSRSLEGWSLHCGGVCWGLMFINTGEKLTSQFLQTGEMLHGLNRAIKQQLKETCLAMWTIKH